MAPPRSVKKQMEREEEDSGGEVGELVGIRCEASVETPFGYLQTLPAERSAAWSQEGLDEAGLGSLSGQWFPLGASPPPVTGAPTSLRVF